MKYRKAVWRNVYYMLFLTRLTGTCLSKQVWGGLECIQECVFVYACTCKALLRFKAVIVTDTNDGYMTCDWNDRLKEEPATQTTDLIVKVQAWYLHTAVNQSDNMLQAWKSRQRHKNKYKNDTIKHKKTDTVIRNNEGSGTLFWQMWSSY